MNVRTGQEMLAALQAQQQPIDLVVLDLRLPNGRGIDLVRSLRRVAPEKPPIVVFSGTIANAAEVRDLASFGVAGYVNEYTGVSHIMPALAPHLFPNTTIADRACASCSACRSRIASATRSPHR